MSAMQIPSESPGQILPFAASRFGDKIALITPIRKLTYRELDFMSNQVASALTAHGVRAGEPVSLYSQNRWEWIVAYHGVLKLGAVVNPVNVMLTPEELGFVLGNCQSTAVFTSSAQAVMVADSAYRHSTMRCVVAFDLPGDSVPTGVVRFSELLGKKYPSLTAPAIEPMGACTIGYTSGTTGYPRGAVQSHRAVLLNCGLTATMHGRNARDIVLTALPAPHVYGNVAINSTFLTGGTVILMERFDTNTAFELIDRYRATTFEGVPAMYAMMLASSALESAHLKSLTRCTVGGQTMARSMMESWQFASGAPLLELWGMTEISGLGTTHALHAPGPLGSVGVALPGVEVRVGDAHDASETLGGDEPGELMIRGPIVMMGYHGDPEATAKVVTDGWLHTGDIARIDDMGHVFIVDRLKDMIITSGYNIYPAEIERVLNAHPAVALAAVGPLPDPVKGELACAYVIRRDSSSVTADEILSFCAQHLAAYKRPREIRFVNRIPTTSTGKIMRRALAEGCA